MNGILRNIIIVLGSSLAVSASSQNFSEILQSIEQNSLHLKAERMKADAAASEASLANMLEAPELGFDYLWGSKDIGNKVDIEFTQSFDFPTVYAKRNQIIKEQQHVSELDYLNERQKLLVRAHKLCIQVVYYNAILKHFEKDLKATRAMAEAYQKLFERGEATIIDRNKSKQAYVMYQAEYLGGAAERRAVLEELKSLNGGNPVVIADTSFSLDPVPADFDQWYAENVEKIPEYQLTKSKVQSEELEVQMARSEWLPKFKIGYAGELGKEERYQGVAAGVSVPVWSAAKKGKVAKARLEAAKLEAKDAEYELMSKLRSVYNDVVQLQKTIQMVDSYLEDCDNEVYLEKSFNSGQITLLAYLQELQFMHEMHVRQISGERDFELRKAELTIY